MPKETCRDSRVGGLIGYAEAYNDDYDADAFLVVQNSYASGEVWGNAGVGGLIGHLETGDNNDRERATLKNNFASGFVTFANAPAYSGGFIGNNDESDDPVTSENNYYDSSGSDGCVYEGEELDNCNAIDEEADTSYFKSNSTNAPFNNSGTINDWDFTNTWDTKTDDYPILRASIEADPETDPVTSSSLTSAEDATPIVLAQTGCSAFGTSSSSKESSFQVQDPAYSYPVGFASFVLTGCGSTATVTASFTGDFDLSKITLRKYNSVTNTYTTLTTANSSLVLTKTTLQGKPAVQAVYQITDGGILDQDSITGQITDPVGIGQLVVGAPNTGLGRL